MEISAREYLEYCTFGEIERPIFVELFGPLIGLEDEWRAQGATEDEISLVAFGFDYVRKYRPKVTVGRFGGLPEKVIEETDAYIIKTDDLGRTKKLMKGVATIDLPLDYPVKDMDSWLKVKHLYEYSEARFTDGWEDDLRRAKAEGFLICGGFPGGFDEPRQLMGEEELCVAYYTQPELIHDMLTTMADTAFRVLERVTAVVPVEHLGIHEDMAGKSGSLIGPEQINTFLQPYYRKVRDLLFDRDCRVFRQDSDGDMTSVVNAFLDCGVTEMYPSEPAAGMDMVTLRKRYGRRLAFSGGIDKHVLRRSKEEIRTELEYKLQPIMRQGGAVFGLDHRIPNGTPIEHYRYYVTTAREILGLPQPGEPGFEPGWDRMAF